jgi:hypothetical protein
MWWEDSNSNYPYYETKKQTTPVKCPVCRKSLGRRVIDELYKEHCEDCKATYTFYPNVEVPTAELDCKEVKKCGCGRCEKR